MNKKVLAILITVVTLSSFSAAYGFTFVPPPTQGFADREGFTYAVEYECGYIAELTPLLFPPGLYGTNIMIHNNQNKATYVYIKILDGFLDKSLWVQNPAVTSQVAFRFPIPADGLLDIDCYEILTAEGITSFTAASTSIQPQQTTVFAKGLIIISQPGADEPLDVLGTYTVTGLLSTVNFYGVSKDVVVYSGTKVENVPFPCVPATTNACPNLPP